MAIKVLCINASYTLFMTAIRTLFSDVFLLKPVVHFDDRGSFSEHFVDQNFEHTVGRKIYFCQDNLTYSKKGVLRVRPNLK